IIVLSFTAVPAFYGISKERAAILASNNASPAQIQTTDIAAEDATNDFDPAVLNDITPAAGIPTTSVEEDTEFSSGFSGISDAALTDFDPVQQNIAPDTTANN
ncbi:MAG: hypothetical protein CUN56_16815, partial [Phototrophicales bacterium]